MRFRRISPFLLVAVCAAACGTSPAPNPSAVAPSPQASPSVIATEAPGASPSPSSSPATALLEVTSEGGFINPASTLGAVPTVEVLVDGRILTPAEDAGNGSSRLVAQLEVRDVGASGVTAILAAIQQAGLDKPATGSPGIPGDSGTTVFTVVINGETTTTRLAAGGAPGPGGPGKSADPGRTAAFALLDRLVDTTDTWGAPSAPAETYRPAGYRVYVAPETSAPDPSASPAPIAWPISTDLATFGAPALPDRGIAGLRQGVVLGDDATRLGAVVATAQAGVTFTSGGKAFTVFIRPLLPDELAN